jgi:3-hydroxyacyl-CoA dehydrogenase
MIGRTAPFDAPARPTRILHKRVEAGWLGRKSRHGFGDYSGETFVQISR